MMEQNDMKDEEDKVRNYHEIIFIS